MDSGKKRFTIGLLVSGITEHFIISICKGVMLAAKEADVNLVVLPGKYIDRDLSANKEIQYEYQYNTLFDYAGADTLDAVIVAADVIGCFTSREKIGQFLDKYKGIPCVLIASKFPGFVSVNSDNYKGIREAMEYLILNKKCTRFGMIGGSDANTDARERKEAFLQILEEYGIPFEDRNYIISDLSKRDKKAAVSFMENNPDVQAVFCVNDDVAINLYEELAKRKLVPGKDIYVFGHDNSTIASKVNPTLSSIWANPNDLGEKALQTALALVKGEKAGSMVLPTRFIMRESIGGVNSHLDISEEEYETMIASYVDSVFYTARDENYQSLAESKKLFELFLRKLFQLLDATKEELYENYADILESAGLIHLENADIDNLLSIFEELCSYICYRHKIQDRKYEIHQLFEILYRKIIHSMNHQSGRLQERQELDNYRFKLFVSNTMQFENGNDQSYTKLISDIDFLGIKNAGICLFEKPMTYLQKDKFICPEQLYLKAILENGVVKSVPGARQRVAKKDLFHLAEISGTRSSLVCLPLFSNEMLYGLLICDLTPQLFDNGEFLANQLGSAVKMIDLLRTNESIQQKLEESLTALKENNIKLDTLSKSDALTGILNRRGFHLSAEELVSQLKMQGHKTLFAYIDMNNLKIINDRYGHDEGDFSLKLIGEILADIVQEEGITGRIGGDEYACVLKYEKEDQGKDFTDRIHLAFQEFNRTSEKAYNVTVSVGTYLMEAEENLTLHDALSHADASLYEAKKNRIKSVAKEQEGNN